MTKAERIYKQTYNETYRHVTDWGYDPETDGGWAGGWITETEKNPDGECIYQRTQNELKRMLERDSKELQYYEKHDIGEKEWRETRFKILLMMARTAQNQYISGK